MGDVQNDEKKPDGNFNLQQNKTKQNKTKQTNKQTKNQPNKQNKTKQNKTSKMCSHPNSYDRLRVIFVTVATASWSNFEGNIRAL